MVASPSLSSSPIGDEMRQLFLREDYDSLLVRTDNLKKRKRLGDEPTKLLIQVLRALSLIQLSRSTEAIPILSTVIPTLPSPGPLHDAANYARIYASWATNDGVDAAVTDAATLKAPVRDARKLHAQLLYRSGRYTEAADIYDSLFQSTLRTLQQKKKPVSSSVSSRWRLISTSSSSSSVAPTHTEQVTAAELERFETSANELATNAMAAFVLAGRADDAARVKAGVRAGYELEYNLACADISQGRFSRADIGLQQAEQLVRARSDMEDEDEIEEALVPVVVQKAYLRQLAGDVAHAKRVYEDVMTEGRPDAASLAVAANNLTVALGQLAFGKQQQQPKQQQQDSSSNTQLLPREQHEALVEGLKKMRATAGKSVERNLTVSQRRAMARNRAILLVQMGRMDACRTELSKLKSEFPGDPAVPMIEASLIARQSGLETADKVLRLAGDSEGVRAARVQLAVMLGERKRAAQLMLELFKGKPAAIVTVAALLECEGEIDEAVKLLTDLVNQAKKIENGEKHDAKAKANVVGAQRALAETLLRVKRYEEAAVILREVVQADEEQGRIDGKDMAAAAVAKLVVATSYFDAAEAEAQAVKIMPMLETKDVDVTALENLPPPKRKQVAAMKGVIAGGGGGIGEKKEDEYDAAAKAQAARERKKIKRKKRLPKNYDPEGPPPDPERWMPKTLRSGYKKNKNRSDQNFRGSQGADAAAADAAAVKTAERSAARAASVATDSGRPRNQRRRKNRK